MTHHPIAPFRAHHGFAAYEAAQFRATAGVNHGDPLGALAALCPGDSYALRRDAHPLHLETELAMPPAAPVRLWPLEGGPALRVTGLLRFMTETAAKLNALLLESEAGEVFLHPLGDVAPATDYTLISIEADPRRLPLWDAPALAVLPSPLRQTAHA